MTTPLTPAIRGHPHPHLHPHPGQWSVGLCPWGCLRCFQQLALSAPSLPSRYQWQKWRTGLPPLHASVSAGGSVCREAMGSLCASPLLAVLPPCSRPAGSTPEWPERPSHCWWKSGWYHGSWQVVGAGEPQSVWSPLLPSGAMRREKNSANMDEREADSALASRSSSALQGKGITNRETHSSTCGACGDPSFTLVV